MRISFFSGPNCCLCDEALSIIETLPNSERPEINTINIRESTEFYHLYAVRIPVLKREDNQQELGWPFNLQQLSQFLR